VPGVLNATPCEKCVKAQEPCIKFGKMGGCVRCSGMKTKCSGVQKKEKGPAVVVEIPRRTRETRSSGSVDGGGLDKELLEEVKGLRAEMKIIAGIMTEWWKRETNLADYAADERLERMGETEGTLDEYVVAGGSGELGEKSGQESAVPLFLPEPMGL